MKPLNSVVIALRVGHISLVEVLKAILLGCYVRFVDEMSTLHSSASIGLISATVIVNTILVATVTISLTLIHLLLHPSWRPFNNHKITFSSLVRLTLLYQTLHMMTLVH